MSANVERNFGTVVITAPAAGDHMGRNGFAKIRELELWLSEAQPGTVSFNTINSRGLKTNGGMINVPTSALIDLLEALKQEIQRIASGSNSEDQQSGVTAPPVS